MRALSAAWIAVAVLLGFLSVPTQAYDWAWRADEDSLVIAADERCSESDNCAGSLVDFWCGADVPVGSIVILAGNLGPSLPDGAKATFTLHIDDSPYVYSGAIATEEILLPDSIRAIVRADDSLFDALAGARSLVLEVDGKTESIMLAGLAEAAPAFVQACRARR